MKLNSTSLPDSGNRPGVAGVAVSPSPADTASPPSWTTTRPPSHRVQMQRSQTTKAILIFQRLLISHKWCNVDLWSCNTLFPTQWYPLLRCRGTVSCVPHLFSCESDARTEKSTKVLSWCPSWISVRTTLVNNPGPHEVTLFHLYQWVMNWWYWHIQVSDYTSISLSHNLKSHQESL